MLPKRLALLLVVILFLVLAVPGLAAGEIGVVYVSSQGLYYDTFVTADTLPMEGRFQLLENGANELRSPAGRTACATRRRASWKPRAIRPARLLC